MKQSPYKEADIEKRESEKENRPPLREKTLDAKEGIQRGMNEDAGVDNHTFNNEEMGNLPTERLNGSFKTSGVLGLNLEVNKETEITLVANDDCGDITSEGNKPVLPVCTFIAEHPLMTFGITGCLHLFSVLLTVVLVTTGYNIFPFQFTSLRLDLEDDWTYLRAKAWNERNNEDKAFYKWKLIQEPERSQNLAELLLLYKSDNVFTAENLRKIQEVEDELTKVPGFGSLCRLKKGICKKPISILRFFDGTYGSQFMDSTFSHIPQILYKAQSIPLLNKVLQFHLGKDCTINASSNVAQSTVTRSVIQFGAPLAGYATGWDRPKEQHQKLKDFQTSSYIDKLKKYNKNGIGAMKFYFYSNELLYYILNIQTFKDMRLAAASCLFIFVIMLMQTQSLFITACAVLSILTSFLGTNLVYRIVLNYQYLSIFHVMSLFLILGIGADDVFVFYDTWRATRFSHHISLAHRLSDCYRKASMSMLITSLTTMVAFLSNALTPLLMISSFGVFSAILILVNYLSVITFLPSVVILYHKHWENWNWPWCKPCSERKQGYSIIPESADIQDQFKPDAKRPNFVIRFFSGTYNSFITHKAVRCIIILVFSSLLAFFTYFAAQIQPKTDESQLFKEDHFFQKVGTGIQDFKPSAKDYGTRVYIILGLKKPDQATCHKTQDCTGRTSWDDSFDLNMKPSQVALLNFCNQIRDMTDEENKNRNLHMRKDPITGKFNVYCFLQRMDSYLQKEGNSSRYKSATDLQIPVTEIKATELMTAHPELYNMSAVSELFHRYFEVALSHWLFDGYSGITTYDVRTYARLVGLFRDQQDTLPVLNKTGYFYGTHLRYVAIKVATTLKFLGLGYPDGLPVVEAWEKFVNEKMSALPSSISNGFQCTPEGRNIWHWLKVQKALAYSAVKGIIIGICLAFVILTLATQNIILGFLATINIVFVTVSVIAIIPLAGWKLGVTESLNLSLVVGLAVDYVVHLVEGYYMAPYEDRHRRLQYMLENVGISVISGAVTTLGASTFMLFAVILFFVEFGVILFCTIGFSLLYSMLLFTTILGMVGPQKDFGSIMPMWYMIKRAVFGRKKTDIDCSARNGRGFIESNKPCDKSRDDLSDNSCDDSCDDTRDKAFGIKSWGNLCRKQKYTSVLVKTKVIPLTTVPKYVGWVPTRGST